MDRHHLVPQMYLRRFADESKKLTMVDRADRDRELTVTVKNACNEVGFYTIPTNDIEPDAGAGYDPDALEKLLSKVEGRTAPVIDKLISANTVPGFSDMAVRNGHELPWDRCQLALFVALQMTRTWGFRRELNEFFDFVHRNDEASITDERIANFRTKNGKPARTQDIQEFRERLRGPDTPRLMTSDSLSIQLAVKYAIENTQPELFMRRWHLRVFDDPVLLTSDAPVAKRSTGPSGTPMPGVANADAIYWPVSRYHLLSFERRSSQDEMNPDQVTINANPGRGRIANSLVASQAEKWIFHHPADRPLEALELPPRPELVDEAVAAIQTPDGIRVVNRVLRR